MISIVLAKRQRRAFLPVFYIGLLVLAAGVSGSLADVGIDIRSDGVLLEGQEPVSYTAAVDNCTQLVTIAVEAGDTRFTATPSETSRIEGSSSGCQLRFEGTGGDLFNPRVNLEFFDGTNQVHAESYQVEKNAPYLTLEEIGLAAIDGRQHLTIAVGADDDVDISYVGFEVTGLRASDLRAAGGVVARARAQAFAATNGIQRVYPVRNEQERFELSLAVTSELSAAAIAHDGVVLLDIVAVDASGNQSSLSKISFTGEDVVEQASDLQVQPARIIFTNLLETATLTPSVEYQFRGRTPLPGLGTGVSYASSHPELIAVTNGGIVYPLAETNGEDVSITISYPDLDPVTVPVEVDQSKYLVSLLVESLNAQGQWVLERLNTRFAWPSVVGVFDDGSQSGISSQFSIEYLLDDSAAGIMDSDDRKGLRSRAIVPDSTPVELTVRLKHQPQVLAAVPVVALDAIPELEFDLPVQVLADLQVQVPDLQIEQPTAMQRFVEGSPIRYQAALEVADAFSGSNVSYVEFFLDGKLIGESHFPLYEERDTAPGQKTTFEIWRVDGIVEAISTTEASRAVHAVIHTRSGGAGRTGGRLIRIIENSPPAIAITDPVAGSSASVGQTVRIDAEMADDTLGIGLSLALYMNEEAVDIFRYENQEERFSGSFGIQKATHTFEVPVVEEMLGTTLRFHLEAVDFHGLVSKTESLKLPVKSDHPPSVAVSHPVDGAHFVAGLPIEIRADATDDIRVQRVDFYVEDRLVGSDTGFPFSYPYETIEGLMVEQSLKIFAVAVDSRNQETRSATIQVTLGKDEQPPVVNIVSPAISATEGGDPLAEVIEESEIVVKIAGYDNVEVNRLELRGIEQQGSQYVLTGNPAHVLTGDAFTPQQIPGALRAFSALKLVRVPLFSQTAGIEHDRYPVEVTATDRTGNSSTASMVVAVGPDKPPYIVQVGSDRERYFARDTVILDIQARDDLGVATLEVAYYVDGAPTSALSESKPLNFPGTNVQATFALDIAALGLTNESHAITAAIAAIDNRGRRSDAAGPFNFEILVASDTAGPLAGISKPVQGSSLFHGERVAVHWKAVDESPLQTLEMLVADSPIYTVNLDGRTANGSFSYNLPTSGEELLITLVTSDVFGNESRTNWRYSLISDEPPLISIRNPAQGSRLIEGEQFTLTASVTDNRQAVSAVFFIEQGDQTLFSKTFNAAAIAAAQAQARYLSAGMRVPHRPEGTQAPLEIGVRATDDGGLTTEELLDMVILDDLEAPRISLDRPDGPFSITPGTSFKVEGQGDDNIYIGDLVPVLVDSDGGETIFNWSSFSRNDRLEKIRVANPQSFGSVIVGQRFYMDFKGRIDLPLSYLNHVGQTFRFIVRAQDRGINVAPTPGIDITILGDGQAPEIRILKPPENVFEGQPLTANVQFSDDISLSAYRVYIDDQPIQILDEADGLNSTFVKTDGLDIDLSGYDPLDEARNQFVLVAEAQDASGNQAREVRIVRIQKDQPPRLSVVDEIPADDLVKGGLAFQTIRVEDDYVTQRAPLRYFPLYTSLNGLGAPGSRDPYGHVFMADDDLSTARPYVTLNYPEADGLPGRLLIKGNPYIEAADGLLTVWPAPTQPVNGDNYLKVDFGPDHTVIYHITTFHDDQCDALKEKRQITAAEGIHLNELINFSSSSDITFVEIVPEVLDEAAATVETFLRTIRIDSRNLSRITSYQAERGTRGLTQKEGLISVYVSDASIENRAALVAAHAMTTLGGAKTGRRGTKVPVPAHYDIDHLQILAHGIDRFSQDRGPQNLAILSRRNAVPDQEAPAVKVKSPANGINLVPMQQITLKVAVTDNSDGFASLQLFENGDTLVREIGGTYGREDYQIPYQVPLNYAGGELDLLLVAEDWSGATQTKSLSFPIAENDPPQLTLRKFSSYKVNGSYRKVLDTPERVNYGEFWVRIGEQFRLDVSLADDSGLEHYTIYRLDRAGNRVQLYRKGFGISCPTPPATSADVGREVTFDQAEPTQYEAAITDNYGNETKRTFLVHPLTNMAPQIRITSPAQDQYIVAGTFRIKVGVVTTDDRILSKNRIEIYANGVRLQVEDIEDAINQKNAIGGYGAIEQAFASMYDGIEQNYSVALADEYGRVNSPYAKQLAYTMEVPSGLIRFNEPVTLMALVKDSDNAIGRHKITFLGAADEINPEVAITRPQPGYGPTEASDFTLGFRAYDNVKVAQLEAYVAYGAREAGGTYRRGAYGTDPIRFVQAVQARDFEPVTTVNIDTPEYKQLIHVDRIHEIGPQIPELSLSGDVLYDVWVKVVARDASGNERTREVSFPIRADERPVVDIVSPINGGRIVEESALIVNVNSFDDVGIDSLRLTATHGSGNVEIYNILLRQPPYQFQVTVPAFDFTDPAQNTLQLHVEAIDSYGAKFGDLDQHRATEDIQLGIVEDQPPAVAIGLPVNESEITEGDYLLVQVNAVDDVGIDRVVLNVAGLLDGDQSFTDTHFPYEFLVEIPYGQAGRDLSLTAATTEIRLAGGARSVSTPTPTIVHVRKDESAPEIVVMAPPVDGATVVEKRTLRFAAEVTDNVRVSTVRVALLADKDADGQFASGEEVSQRLLLEPPFIGTIAVKSLADYLGAGAEGVDQLALQITFVATDGAGNRSEVSRPVTLVRNQPPQVEQIQILDARGFNLGSGLAEITEGRGIVVHVVASDREAGVDAVSLYRTLGEADDAAEYENVGRDEAAPFQFHITVPVGHVGQTIRFRAEATDVDGYTSPPSAARGLTILPDQPPTADIIKPDNDESVIIEGQDIEVFVEAVDDLGISGIDRVVFYVNEIPVQTAYSSWSELSGSAAQEHVYRALISPPDGAQGFVIYAVAYDVLGQAGRSQTVRVGQIEDTVAPKLSVLAPVDGDILTAGRSIRPVVAAADIGIEADRRVYMRFIREYQEAGSGEWLPLHENEIELFRNDARSGGDTTPASEPDNHYYIYWADFVDGDILRRTAERNERVRTVARIVTPNHTVQQETTHEVGLPVSERRFLLPALEAYSASKSVYHTAVDQFRGEDRTGALVAAWATQDPMRLEPEIGNLTIPEFEPEFTPRTGLFIADDTNEAQGADGDHYVYSELMAGASEMFLGTITELYADADFVLAAKSGQFPSAGANPKNSGFAAAMQVGIEENPETGGVYLENESGELLIYNVRNGDEQFGLPYLLTGRVDMPYPDVYGVARKDNLVLVANGNGGVQVVDISKLSAPYHVGYIKPNGFTRDVAVFDHFAVIAASHEGIVIADLKDPTLPIVASRDTLGVDNRLFIEGTRLYVADMAGDGQTSQLNIFNISDPYNPKLERTVDLRPARVDLVPDGVYDAFVAGGKAYVTVHYSDQEDKPAQSVVEIVDLGRLDTPLEDATVPAMVHRRAGAVDFAARGLIVARGALQVAAGMQGMNRIELPALSVLVHTPAAAERNVSTALDKISIELSAVLSAGTDLDAFVRINVMDPFLGEDVSQRFEVAFAMRDGEPARRFVEVTPLPGEELLVNTQYFVTVVQGLAPLTGLPLNADYTFGFTTTPAGGFMAPDIHAIVPATGGIDGNTAVVVTGENFGENPALYLGGQRLVIDQVTTAAASGEAYDRIEARTVPNYAGPAAVEVINDGGLSDVVLGAFTYVDILQISFINPAVVRVSQAGRGDRVEVVGYGFHDGVVLRAYRSGQPEAVITTVVDNDRLSLYSAEKMSWVVPDFGDSFRGFVDVDISDDQGRRFLLPNGLFYGRLQEDRRLQPEPPFTKDEIDDYLNPNTPAGCPMPSNSRRATSWIRLPTYPWV